ncbi:MAG TPA: hypothetical protein VHX52_05265 [Steroidobacteraceae bacterium]|jgi:hypothetical protein|nr:hypothetical protein [Steroidobacteraceae bacterium]
MATDAFIQCRVAPATKAALRAAAERQQLTESALIKRVIETQVLAAAPADADADAGAVATAARAARPARLYVRLTPGDRALLRERASARCLAPATYASTLIRAHLRGLTPVPAEELQGIRRSTMELAAIGRNLNQIPRASLLGVHGPVPSREELRAVLTVCEALREHVRSFVRKNASSWESGDAASG